MLRTAVFRLLRFPGLLFAVVAGAMILAVVSASAPVFLSSVGSLTLHRFLAQASESELPALVLTIDSTPAADVIAYRTRLLERELDGAVGSPIVTARGDVVTATGPRGSAQVRIVTRTAALDHVDVVRQEPDDGLWLADFTADALGLKPGDRVAVEGSAGRADVVVAGVYADLLREPRTPYWATLDTFIYPSATAETRPPAFLLMDLEEYVELEARLHDDQDVLSWEFPLPRGSRSLDDARGTVGAIARLRSRLANVALEVGSAFGRVNTSEPYSGWVGQAEEVVAAIEGPVETLSLAGRAIGLALLGGAGVFMVRRRRTELAVLRVRGVGPVGVGARTVAETVLPVLVGTALGCALAIAAVRADEPTAAVAPASVAAATVAAAIGGLLGVALLAIVTGRATSDRAEPGLDRARRAASRIPWDTLLLGFAALAFVGLQGRDTSGDAPVPTELDRLLLLFPILFIAGAAGLAARALRWLVPWIRRTGTGLRVAPYLASRRLAAAPSQAGALLIGAAVAIGLLVYAGTVTASVDATALQEGALTIGSDASIVYTGADPPVAQAPFAATRVVGFERASFAAEGDDVDVLAIDGGTFAEAAYWQSEFASEPLDGMLAALATPARGRVPVLLVGASAPDDPVLGVSGYDLPVSVVGTPRTFPGVVGDRTLVVADRGVLEEALAERGGSIDRMAHSSAVWARASEDELLTFARTHDTTVIASADAAELRTTPAYLALSSMLRFLAATGGLAAVVVLLGTHLYLQGRQRQAEASYALLRRMGLSRGAHRRSVALELAGLLFVSFAIGGGLAIVASLLVNADVQAGPLDASVTLFRAPVPLLAATAAALVAAAWAGAVLVQRRADRTNVAEAMRVVE